MHVLAHDLQISPSLQRSRERRWIVLAVLCVSLVVVVMGNVALNIALPDITRSLGASFSSLQWMVDAYGLLFAGLLLFAGALGDRFGRKGALQAGLATFGLASLAASFSTETWQVIAARAVMGLAAAFVMPGTLSILAAVFDQRDRPKAIAIWAGIAGASVAIGMLWSGLLLEHFGWSSVFLTNVPIVVIALVLGAWLLPKSADPNKTPLDRVGAVLSVVTLGALLFALIEGPVEGWTTPRILAGFALAITGFVTFVKWERRVESPMLDLTFFDDPRFTLGCAAIVTAFLCLFGLYFLLTQYLQEVRGYSPLAAGARTVPAGIAQLVASPVSARLVERHGYRPILSVGLVAVAAGAATLGLLGPTSSDWVLAIGLVLLGLGVGTATPPATGAIVVSLPMGKAGVGSAVNDTTRELGGAVGIALLGSLVSVRFRSGIASAIRKLPTSARSSAEHGVGPALQLVHSREISRAAPKLSAIARSSFTSGLLLAALIGAAIALVGSVLVRLCLPDRFGQPSNNSKTSARTG